MSSSPKRGKSDSASTPATGLSRRGFLQAGGLAGAGALAAGPAVFAKGPAPVQMESIGHLNGSEREIQAFQRRFDAAVYQYNVPVPDTPDNGDDALYANERYIGSFTKTLPHNNIGEVDPAAYEALLQALSTGDRADFDQVPGGGGGGRLANPRAAFSYSMEGPDGHKVGMPAVHALASARQASEAAEVYWKALLRDVNFADYENHSMAVDAAADLTAFSDFTGPREGGDITPATLFRGLTPGDLAGPYISQFLFQGIPYGNRVNRQMAFNPETGQAFMANNADYLAVQNGFAPPVGTAFQSTARFIQTGRDLAEYVHSDWSYQAYLNASLICLGFGGAARDENPYSIAQREGGFVTYGPAAIWTLVGQVATLALRVAWFHKWLVHRKLRPEAFGARVEAHIAGDANYPLNAELLNSACLPPIFSQQGNYHMPQAFPEGSPTHPSYPAGHATIAGACVTVLKAFFNEDFEIPAPVVPTDDGRRLRGYGSGPLTIGGELNKLASNIAIGRNIAGVHWRADGDDGLVAGEAAAILFLQDVARAVTEEDASSFVLRRFDGVEVQIDANEVTPT